MIPDDVRRYAEDPGAFGPDLPPQSGLERILTDRYCLMLGPVPSFTIVSRLRLEPSVVAATVTEVRAHVRERRHRRATWWVGSSATPADLGERLRAHGFVPDDGPGSESHATSMALVHEPPRAPADVVARRVDSLDEFRLAGSLGAEAFGSPEEEREEWDAIAEERYAAERAGHAPRCYLAFVDGDPVGTARAIVADDVPAVMLIGGAVLPHARGRSVYRALVRARWDDAAAAGTPALVTQAGTLSRPILERLGFEPVADVEILVDPEPA